MSRVYFHSPSGEAELRGSERAWLNHLSSMPGRAAWDLDGYGAVGRAVQIVSLKPEVPEGEYGANYLNRFMREAIAQEAANKEVYSRPDWRTAATRTTNQPQDRFLSSLKTALTGSGLDLEVAGTTLNSFNLELNTALVAGSDPIRLAAKIHGWCEVHAWVDGPDRAWLADIMQAGVDGGMYRRGVWYEPTPGGEKKWSSQGWDEVIAFLQGRDDEPVVMSYSVCDSFPNVDIGDGLPAWPEGVEKSWDNLTEEQQAKTEAAQEAWYDLTDEERWQRGMDGLRRRRPWAQLTPDTLAATSFGPGVTVFDVFASDRDERIAALVAAYVEPGVGAP